MHIQAMLTLALMKAALWTELDQYSCYLFEDFAIRSWRGDVKAIATNQIIALRSSLMFQFKHFVHLLLIAVSAFSELAIYANLHPLPILSSLS